MNYQSIYDQIIAKHIDSPRIKGKTNSHHIIPKSFAKIDGIEDIDGKWNKVNLPLREHFIAHLLLDRIWRGHKAKGPKMAYAFRRMSNSKYTSKVYEWLKLNFAYSEETKAKISTLSKGRIQSEETKIKRANANRGKVRTEETKAKISAAAKQRKTKKNNHFVGDTL